MFAVLVDSGPSKLAMLWSNADVGAVEQQLWHLSVGI